MRNKPREKAVENEQPEQETPKQELGDEKSGQESEEEAIDGGESC